MRKAVAAIILHNGHVLVGKKIRKEKHFISGGWHIPGGHVHKNEDEVTALIREMKEETNLDVEVGAKLTSTHITINGTEVHWYICKPLTLELKPMDDLEDAKFVSRQKVVDFCDTRATELWPQEVFDFLAG
jgi:8-oxo-dGTP diphosphatase